ncbi:SagB family peptide dehydrogenase [Streptomyces sp. t39]|uniref:SagB family peptide dehydrogenase n=1 Tax=Streptomyces sp. t39 TaxID=1828156 RepID=UPI0011CDBD7C|nr:SagB family peptide dehydrogenase [Streptomyces sp. t39]TXS51913.1 SagB/ThcOx family dehydrogenase [Streptomyces sp. t39]
MTTLARADGTEGAAERRHSLHVALDKDEAAAERLLLGTVAPWAAAREAAGDVGGWFAERTDEDGGRLTVHVWAPDGRAVAALGEALRAAVPDPAAVAEGPDGVRPGPAAALFGGDEGFARCVPHLARTARTALAALRAAPSREKRLRAAAALLLASATAADPEPRRAASWLRTHTSTLAADRHAARSGAEQDHFRNEAEWRQRHAATRAELALPGTTAGDWYRDQCALRAALAPAHEAGVLTAAPGEVLRTFARLLANQLGLTAQDEAYAAWLVSMDLVSGGPRLPYFADTQVSPDRLLHEHGKFFGARLMDQRPDMPGATAEGRQELPAPLARIALERPAVPGGAPPFEEVLLARRSAYGTYRGPFTLGDLGALLHFSAGVTAHKTMPGADASYPVRPYPSGGTRYPLRVLLYCHDVEGLERGTYLYDAAGHALELIGDQDICAELMRMAPATDPSVVFPPKAGGNLHVDDCPLWVFTVADLTFQRLHYGLRSYRLVLQESGHLAQNLALVATWLGKSSVGIGGFYDDTVNAALGLDGVDSSVVYVHLVGVVEPPSPD